MKATECGHWTTLEYCEKHGIRVYEHVKPVEEGGRLKKDGTLDRSRKGLRADVLCAKCRPKTSEEIQQIKAKRKEYARRKRLRDSIEVSCPVCGETVRARRDSVAFESFVEGTLVKEEAEKLIIGAHIRHEHTDYDEIRRRDYERLREEGLEWEEAHAEAKMRAHQMKKRLSG